MNSAAKIKTRERSIGIQLGLLILSLIVSVPLNSQQKGAETEPSCRPRASRIDDDSINALMCLREIAARGAQAHQSGPAVMPFLSSDNAAEQAYGINTLAAIGYSEALPQIEVLLHSSDWRVTYAAVRAIGWLGDTKAVPQLRAIASQHWLQDVRDQAKRALAALESPKGKLDGPWQIVPFRGAGEPFWIDYSVLKQVNRCASGRWTWNGQNFETPKRDSSRALTLNSAEGTLLGTNRGEFGGDLRWKPRDGKTVLLHADNVDSLVPDGESALVLFGLSHLTISYGYVLRVSPSTQGGRTLSQVAYLPAKAEWITTVAPGLFAALSYNRAVVFNSNGILGTADCVMNSK